MDELKISVPKEINIKIGADKEIKNHDEMKNLSFENSGHTGFQKELTFDATPTQDSENPVTSGGVYECVNEIENQIGDIDTALDSIIAIQDGLTGGDGA